MKLSVKKSGLLRNTLYRKTLSSGVKCYIIPKYGATSTYALVTVGYGGVDTQFHHRGKLSHTPEGTAHFLEHKLFEEEWGDQFTAFAEAGAKANAFTDFGKTAYFFSASDHLEENLNRLIAFVQSPYFQEDSVKRERDIIAQEIDMYADDSSWQSYFNMLEALYFRHPIRHQIAGDAKSISHIHADTLYEAYRAFYQPQNMAFVCVGDVSPEWVLNLTEKGFRPSADVLGTPVDVEEPGEIRQSYIEKNMAVELPVFQIGYKHDPLPNDLSTIYGTKMLLDLLFGEASDFQATMEQRGLLDTTLDFQLVAGRDFAFTALGGISKDPEAVLLAVQACFEQANPTREEIDRIRRKHTGRFLRGMGNGEAILMSQTELALQGFDVLEVFDTIRDMRKEDILGQLPRYLTERVALSVIRGEE